MANNQIGCFKSLYPKDIHLLLTPIKRSVDGDDGELRRKKQKFLSTGKLAVGIKYTRDGIEIAENLQSIGYILFHTRKDIGQHLFHVKSVQLIKSVEEMPVGIYKNVNTTEMYIVVDIDTSNEMDASEMHSSRKAYTPNTRYDAQYIKLSQLKSTK